MPSLHSIACYHHGGNYCLFSRLWTFSFNASLSWKRCMECFVSFTVYIKSCSNAQAILDTHYILAYTYIHVYVYMFYIYVLIQNTLVYTYYLFSMCKYVYIYNTDVCIHMHIYVYIIKIIDILVPVHMYEQCVVSSPR